MATHKKYAAMKAGSPDNFQTPPSALDCLLPHLPNDWKIWEPAAGKGKLVMRFFYQGYWVTGTDVLSGDDFLSAADELPADQWDCVVTNPPFSLKDQFLARCYELGKPFALLLPLAVFDSKARRQLFGKKQSEAKLDYAWRPSDQHATATMSSRLSR